MLLSSCQTHLPVISDSQPCEETIETIELTDIDYLLYANQMIDSMINSRRVQQERLEKRMKVFFVPVINKTDDTIELTPVNIAVFNRLLRSGQFILNEEIQNSQFQLSGSFDESSAASGQCAKPHRRFKLQLKSLKNGEIIWSEEKKFN